MPTLTKARTAQLCTEIRALAIKAAACSDGPHSFHATMLREMGLEHLLMGLAVDMAGDFNGNLQALLKRSTVARDITAALQHEPTEAEIQAHRAAQLARQQQILARATAATTPRVPA